MGKDFGPYWTVDSDEVGAGILIWLVVLLSPVIPAAVLGYLIGDAMGGVNVIRYGMALLFAAGAAWFYIRVMDMWGWKGFALFYIGQWILFDIFYAAAHGRTPIFAAILKAIFAWAVGR